MRPGRRAGGCNRRALLEEKDRRPMHLCPVCVRKLCWHLQVETEPYLAKLEAFCRRHGFGDEAEWYGRARAVLAA